MFGKEIRAFGILSSLKYNIRDRQVYVALKWYHEEVLPNNYFWCFQVDEETTQDEPRTWWPGVYVRNGNVRRCRKGPHVLWDCENERYSRF